MVADPRSTEDSAPDPAQDATLGQLMAQLSQQTSRLVHDEIALAKAEISDKAKHAGIGAGLFGVAGVLAWFGLGCLLATAILALARVMDGWLAALVVTVVVFAAAGVAALAGKRQVSAGVPPVPQQTIASVERDVEAVKEAARGR